MQTKGPRGLKRRDRSTQRPCPQLSRLYPSSPFPSHPPPHGRCYSRARARSTDEEEGAGGVVRKGGKTKIMGPALDIITSVGIRMSSRYVVQQAAPAYSPIAFTGGEGVRKRRGCELLVICTDRNLHILRGRVMDPDQSALYSRQSSSFFVWTRPTGR